MASMRVEESTEAAMTIVSLIETKKTQEPKFICAKCGSEKVVRVT